MKNLKSLFAVIIFCLAFSTLKSQSTYTITNNTNEYYYVELTIADSPTTCHLGGSPPPRTAYHLLFPDGCSFSQASENLGVDEWVYKVIIYDYSGCPTTCSGTAGSARQVGSMEPCDSNKDTTSWSSCASDNAAANTTTYCNIND